MAKKNHSHLGDISTIITNKQDDTESTKLCEANILLFFYSPYQPASSGTTTAMIRSVFALRHGNSIYFSLKIVK